MEKPTTMEKPRRELEKRAREKRVAIGEESREGEGSEGSCEGAATHFKSIKKP